MRDRSNPYRVRGYRASTWDEQGRHVYSPKAPHWPFYHGRKGYQYVGSFRNMDAYYVRNDDDHSYVLVSCVCLYVAESLDAMAEHGDWTSDRRLLSEDELDILRAAYALRVDGAR